MRLHYLSHNRLTIAVLALAVTAALAACRTGEDAALASGHDASAAVSSLAVAADPEWVAIPPGSLQYYPPGEYLKNGYPTHPKPVDVTIELGVSMMKRQVSQAEYAACVRAKACKPLDRQYRDAVDSDLPVVGVSWRDATDYAEWLTKRTGVQHRLPTYAEWVVAAGSAYKEDALLADYDDDNPARRWLAEYALESQRKATVDAALRPFGGFGVNELGMMDMAGNVWDWTNTCHSRHHVDNQGDAILPPNENCGVRVVGGPHRSAITDFIREAKSGACSVGVPPSNLGFRLVRDSS